MRNRLRRTPRRIRSATCSGETACPANRPIQRATFGWSRSTPAICTVCTSGVFTAPGTTTDTPMRCRARSKRSTSDSAAQAVLAGAVGGMPRQRDQSGGRGDVDQVPAAACRHHGRHEGLDDVDRAHQVDVDHRFPVLVGQRSTVPHADTPGDVHHHVHRADDRRGCRARTRRRRRSRRCPAPGARAPRAPSALASATVFSRPSASRSVRKSSAPSAASSQSGGAADAAGGAGEKTTLARETAAPRHGGDPTAHAQMAPGAAPQRIEPQPLQRHRPRARGSVPRPTNAAVVRQRHRRGGGQRADQGGQVAGDRAGAGVLSGRGRRSWSITPSSKSFMISRICASVFRARVQAGMIGSLLANTAAALPTIRLANSAGVSLGSRGAKSWVSCRVRPSASADDHGQHGVLGVEVEVEARPGDAGPLTDGADGQIGEGLLLEQFRTAMTMASRCRSPGCRAADSGLRYRRSWH